MWGAEGVFPEKFLPSRAIELTAGNLGGPCIPLEEVQGTGKPGN